MITRICFADLAGNELDDASVEYSDIPDAVEISVFRG